MDDKFYKKRIKEYKENRENVLSGNINCIPSPFVRFRSEFPGIEQGKYYLVSGNEKSGKSQISDFLFMLHPLMYAFNNPDKLKLKILYFSLEMSKAEKYDQMTCFWLYMHSHGKIRIDTKILNSLNEESPLSSEVLGLLESPEYSRFFDFVEDNVIFYESIGNPTGINKECIRFAESRGRYTYKNMDWQIKDPITGEQKVEKRQVIDEFIKDDK